MLTKNRLLSWLEGTAAAVSFLMLLSTLTSRGVAGTAAVPVPESVPSVRPAGNKSETSRSSGTTIVEHAAVKPKTDMTLSDLLEDNRALLEVIGVFTAVSVFIGQLQIRWFAHVLSFLFMVLVVVLCVELWTKFPRDTDSFKVMLFQGTLAIAVFFLFLDLFVDYRDIWRYFLFVPIFVAIFYAVLTWFVVPLARKTPVHRNRALLKLAALAVAVVLSYYSLRLAVQIEPSVNRFLDALNKLVSGWSG